MSKIISIVLFICITNMLSGALDKIKQHAIQAISKRSCASCQKSAPEVDTLKRCAKCKMCWYCSEACQIADWHKHKPKCVGWAKKSVLEAVTHLKPLQAIITGYLNQWVESHSIAGKYSFKPDLAYSPNGQYLLSHGDTDLYVWNSTTYSLEKSLTGTKKCLKSSHYSPDGNYIVSFSFDYEIKIWDPHSYKLLKSFDGESIAIKYPDLRRDKKYRVGIESILPVYDNKLVISFYDKIFIYDWQTETVGNVIDERSHQMKISPDGKYLAGAVSGGGGFKIWDAHNLNQLHDKADWLYSPHNSIDATAFSPNRAYYANGTAAGKQLHIRDTRNYEIIKTIEAQYGIQDIAFSANGKYVSFTDSCYVYIYDLHKNKLVHTIKYDELCSVCFSPDSATLAVGMKTGIKIWQLPTELE